MSTPSASLERLLDPFDVGPVHVRNRVFVSAHTTNFGQHNLPTKRHAAYHGARASGGVGLIITEGVRVHPSSAARASAIGAFTPDCVPHFARISEAVAAGGGRVFAQLIHLGRQSAGDYARTASWGASPDPWAPGSHVPHAMTADEIRLVVQAFADAATWMAEAGFDGVELHLGHGHLLQQFLSPAVNRRNDSYGGSLENRLRMSFEVLEAVRDAVQDRIAVGIRISADEFLPGGLEPNHMVEVVGRLQDRSSLDFLHVSHSAYVGAWTLSTQMADMTFGTAPFRHLIAPFRAAFPGLPTLAICRLDNPHVAADMLARNEADLVGMTRAHIADPEIVTKVREGREGTIRSCIACNQGCIGRVEQGLPMSCVVNPRVGLEHEWDELDANGRHDRHRVLVIGGGPAGLAAAREAAAHGHEVTLAEAADDLGGRIRVAAAMEGRARFGLLVEDLERDVRAAGVTVRTGWTVRPEDVSSGPWTALVLAIGSDEVPMTVGEHRAVPVTAAVIDPLALGRHVVVYDEDGTWSGAGTALHLAAAGLQVQYVSPIGVAWRVTTYSRLSLLRLLADKGVDTHPGRRLATDADGSLQLVDTVSGRAHPLDGVSSVVHAGPRAARTDAARRLLADFSGPVQVVGDAYAPRSALEAVYDGQLAGAWLGLRSHPRFVLAPPHHAAAGTPFHL